MSKPRNFEELCNKYQGTCFIVGSGPSLHSQKLDFLSDHTVIAVNGGYVRVPDADFFLTDDQDCSEWSYCFKDLRQSEKTQVLLYEWKFKNYGNWRECERWYKDRLISFSHRQGYNLTHEYKHNDPKYGIWQARSSSGSATHCAYLMGFKEVVLLGMDGIYSNGKRHFYELGGWPVPVRNRPFFQSRHPRKIYNKQTDHDLMEVVAYWNGVNKSIGDHFKLYNGSPISVIKTLPKVNLEQYVQR